MQLQIHVTQCPWYNSIVTAYFKSVLHCVKVLIKTYATPKVFIIIQIYWFKLILKPTSKFQKVLKLRKWKKLSWNHNLLFLFPLTPNSFSSNWRIHSKRALVLNHWGTFKERVAYWLASRARKAKIPGMSPASSYVQRWGVCGNRPANIWVSVKRVEVVERS